MNLACFIGIDVGGTKIYGGLVSPAGEIFASQKKPTPFRATPKEIITTIEKVIQDLLKEGELPLKKILGIGLAVPGIVDNNGRVIVTPNINLSGTDLKKILEKKYRVKVAVGNDVNLGVLGEKWLGAGRKAKNIVGIFPGTGVGGGVIVEGRFMTGTNGAAAELGHMMVDAQGPKCTCGNTGCLEAIVGRWAIERDIRAAMDNGERSIITDIAGKDLKQIKSSSLAKALDAGDKLVTHIMTASAEALAKACVSLNHIFNPDMFLFGGGVIEACGDFILPKIERAIKKDPFFSYLPAPKIVQAKLGDDAVMLGAVAAVRQGLNLKKLNAAYYPTVKILASGKVSAKKKAFSSRFFIRADGKVREPKEFFPPKMTDAALEEICKKGPDALFVAIGRGKNIVLSPKAVRFLKKKRVSVKILPLGQAIQAYNTSEERKAILFNI